jgi:hypothetical protein
VIRDINPVTDHTAASDPRAKKKRNQLFRDERTDIFAFCVRIRFYAITFFYRVGSVYQVPHGFRCRPFPDGFPGCGQRVMLQEYLSLDMPGRKKILGIPGQRF